MCQINICIVIVVINKLVSINIFLFTNWNNTNNNTRFL